MVGLGPHGDSAPGLEDRIGNEIVARIPPGDLLLSYTPAIADHERDPVDADPDMDRTVSRAETVRVRSLCVGI
jgi:hypothetical protein